MPTETRESSNIFGKKGGKKSKKSFVLAGFGPDFPPALRGRIEEYIKAKHPKLTIIKLRKIEDIAKQSLRNISLIVIDESFYTLDESMDAVSNFKIKKSKEAIPTLFFTRNEEELIKKYQEKLAMYQEVDDFINIEKTSNEFMYEKLDNAILYKNKRRSRRFKFSLPVRFFHLSKSIECEAELNDLSLHGALITAKDFSDFKIGDQLLLSMPIGRYSKFEIGEFVKISALVRRNFISGSTVGLSFEHFSATQLDRISAYLFAEIENQVSFL